MEATFKIVEHLGVYIEANGGWQGEINKVSWNGREPKIDIRKWDKEHKKMSKGITLTDEEARMVAEILYRV